MLEMHCLQESSLDKLPEELLFYLFEWLDPQSLLLHLSQTCHRLRDIVYRYDRNQLDFQNVSKKDFYRLCRVVKPKNIISITLTNEVKKPPWIHSFLSLVHINQLSQLRSLSLHHITVQQFTKLIDMIPLESIRSCSIHLVEVSQRQETELGRILSFLLAQTRLHQFELAVPLDLCPCIVWPEKSAIRRLALSMKLDLNQLCHLLDSLPHLKTVIIDSIEHRYVENQFQPFKQIKSMTMKQLSIEIDQLEYILSLMPSLTHLKLITKDRLIHGTLWEQIIVRHLPYLNHLEFSMDQWCEISNTLLTLTKLLTPFRTSFWLEDKRWSITGEYCIDTDKTIHLYTVPLCLSSYIYQPSTRMISLSNQNSKDINNTAYRMSNIDTLQLNVAAWITNDIEYYGETVMQPLFEHVKKLQLLYSHPYSRGWIKSVLQLIDLSKVETIHLNGQMIRQTHPQLLADLGHFLQQCTRISSLHLCDEYYMRKSDLTADQICTIVPIHTKHLGVSIRSLEEAQKVLNELTFLCSAHFYFDSKCTPDRPPQWLHEEHKYSTYQLNECSLQIWLAKKKM